MPSLIPLLAGDLMAGQASTLPSLP
jgi:F0F1-type ATP synthase membrane subunit a